MNIDTKKFGQTEIDENNIFTFESGIPGFVHLKKFVVLSEDNSFYWLQSIEDKDIAFILMDVYNIIPDYNPLATTEDLQTIIEAEGDKLTIYNIVSIPENINKMSVNLKAPIVLNMVTKKGRQIILQNDDYPIKYFFYEEMTKNKKTVR